METHTVCVVCLVRAEVADVVGGLFEERGGFKQRPFI